VLNVSLKESSIIFIIKHRFVVFSFDCFNWVDLAHVMTIKSLLMHVWSFSLYLAIPLYALINTFVTVHDYGRYCSLKKVTPILLLAITLYWVWALLVHPISKSQVCQLCPPYLPTCGISPPLQSKYLCATFKTFKNFSFYDTVFSSWGSCSWAWYLPY
jgi:hypothetical protein